MRIASALMVVMLGTALAAQEGAATLPSNYKVTFENAWVKVTSVRYEGKQKLPGHTHTPNPAAYVYLNDGPPVIFTHVGGKPATRAATKAGAFRVYRGLDEVHEVENTGAAPSEFLRVELKTTPLEPGSFFGKFERPASPSGAPVVHFNHSQLRVSRLWIQPGQELGVTTTTEPALIIALAPGAGLRTGETRWVAASSAERLKNTSSAAIDVLRFDLRTQPKKIS
ncbi:MAG TPA: hypothetical protein VNT81_17235 [Vicinamibacterales bacterium]|nr:hypothetical protein [Vicinamibacterales bacterium]